jgi:hypothetical protein
MQSPSPSDTDYRPSEPCSRAGSEPDEALTRPARDVAVPNNADDPAFQALLALNHALYPTADEAIAALRDASRALGFGVVKRRVRYSRRKANGEAGGVKALDIECTSGSSHCKRKGTGLARRVGCEWKASVNAQTKAGLWRIVLKNTTHNHLASVAAEAIPVHRRQAIESANGTLLALQKMPKQTCPAMADFLRGEGHHVTARDVRNRLAKERRAANGNSSPFERFLACLRERPDISHKVRRAGDLPEGEIVQIFWTYRHCVDLWKKHPVLLSFDNTYRTNRYRWPLMNVTGVNNVNSTFNVAFALSTAEGTADFEWILRYVIPPPKNG